MFLISFDVCYFHCPATTRITIFIVYILIVGSSYDVECTAGENLTNYGNSSKLT